MCLATRGQVLVEGVAVCCTIILRLVKDDVLCTTVHCNCSVFSLFFKIYLYVYEKYSFFDFYHLIQMYH